MGMIQDDQTGAGSFSAEPTFFLIVGMQRSGTTVVHQIVAGHPEVASNPREAAPRLFFDFGAALFNTDRKLFEADKEGLSEREVILDLFRVAVEQNGRIAAHSVAGLKVATGFTDQARRMVDAILEHLPDLKIIHVRRADPVAACASFLYASENRRFQIHEGENKPRPKITVETEYLLKYLYAWHSINRELERLSQLSGYTCIEYERDIASGEIFDGRAPFNFLGLRPLTVDWVTLTKSLPAKEEMITNAAECDAIAAAMMDDLRSGATMPALYRRYGPSLLEITKLRLREVGKHPMTCMRRSFWRPFSWKLFAS